MVNLRNYSNIIIDISPVDMRNGVDGLMVIAKRILSKDDLKSLYSGESLMVFTGKSIKIIGFDDEGCFAIIRYLKKGAFQRLRGRAIGAPTLGLTLFELEQYWDGNEVQLTR